MNRTTTYLDLFNYAYNDCDLINSDRVQRAIDGDPQIKNDFDEVVNVINTFDQGVPQVSDKCIEKILQFC